MTRRQTDTVRIADPGDPRVAVFRDIRERDLVGRQGVFVAEGRVVLNVLLDAPAFEICSMLILENRLTGLADILARVPGETPVHVADATVMDAIAGFPMHRGILAIGRRKSVPGASQLLAALPAQALILILVGIANHDNLGAIFRNATAFGADAILLDPTCCDPLYRKSIRVSVGGVFRTPFARFENIDTMIAALVAAGFDSVALSPQGENTLSALTPGGRMALVLGAEGEGLPASLLARLRTARIPMARGFDSLNVATAAAIALHHFRT